MRKKVCIIYTGGTIGMVATERGFAPESGYLLKVLNNLTELCSNTMPEWDLIEFETLVDSSDISVGVWNRIVSVIRENYDSYDGFVVLHGTDTMAYTASALSFMLEGLGKPVVLTGSQIPIGQVRSDARENLVTALLIAGEGKCPEVSLYFGGKLLRGNRATKVSANDLAAFDSPNYPELANVGIDVCYDKKRIRNPGGRLQVTAFSDDLAIAVLKIFPGIQFQLFESIMTDQLKGLVLEAFGVGNVPQYEAEMLPLIRRAAENGTVITVCTQCLRGTVQLGTYAASSSLRAAGAVSGHDMTVEAAVTKLRYLFAKGYDTKTICSMMETDLRGELTR